MPMTADDWIDAYVPQQCEWCEDDAVWRVAYAGYERFACKRHLDKVRRGLMLDRGTTNYIVEPWRWTEPPKEP